MAGDWILAIDQGNGGPKVAAIGADGEILAQSLRGVAVTIEPDGTATQDAAEWIEAVVAAVRDVTAVVPARPCTPSRSPASGAVRCR